METELKKILFILRQIYGARITRTADGKIQIILEVKK